jgi:hypothetical protein
MLAILHPFCRLLDVCHLLSRFFRVCAPGLLLPLTARTARRRLSVALVVVSACFLFAILLHFTIESGNFPLAFSI